MRRAAAVTAATLAITAITWAGSTPSTPTPMPGQVGELFGSLALVTMALMLVIATRWPIVDRLCGGLDKAYVAHKWLGIASFALLIGHLLALHAARLPRSEQMLVHAGGPAFVMLLAALMFALVARKVNYQAWKLVHLLVVVPYGIGVAHYYGASSFQPFGFSPFSLWLDVVNLVGVVAAIWAVVFFCLPGRRYRYGVSTCRPVADGVLEITAKPLGRAIDFKPGQFAFITVPRLGFASHPFTVSSGTGEPLQFTVKALGDDTTRLVNHLQPGDRLSVAGPYGGFDPAGGLSHQIPPAWHAGIWIAAGIGITPFRSLWRTGLPDRLSVDLFYAYHGVANGAYLDELAAINRPNFRVHLVDTVTEGRLSAAKIADTVATSGPYDVYFCGPGTLRDALRADLPAAGIDLAGFHYEEFDFGRRHHRPSSRQSQQRSPVELAPSLTP